MSPPILVIGKSGQLASVLRGKCEQVICLGRTDVDLSSEESVRAAVKAHDPQAVINAAAYTAVDRAENEREQATALNAVAPGLIAHVCAEANVPLVHVSTDFVFDGEGGAPYPEDHPTRPLNVYGETKARGEERVLACGGQAAIVRTSWVFSEVGTNFVRTMLRLAEERDEITVVADQRGRPTSAHTLAEACLMLADAMAVGWAVTGVYHVANEGEASWFELAEAVMEEAEARGWKAARIRPIPAADYPVQARRPRDSRMATGRIEQLLGWAAPHWRSALADVLDRMQRSQTRELTISPASPKR